MEFNVGESFLKMGKVDVTLLLTVLAGLGVGYIDPRADIRRLEMCEFIHGLPQIDPIYASCHFLFSN
jgi:hypothetical protein